MDFSIPSAKIVRFRLVSCNGVRFSGSGVSFCRLCGAAVSADFLQVAENYAAFTLF